MSAGSSAPANWPVSSKPTIPNSCVHAASTFARIGAGTSTSSTPVNVLTLDGERYLVAARGTTEWVRNVRAAGTGRLSVGRREEWFDAVEVHDDTRLPVLRAYLKRWRWEVGAFFDGLTADASDDELRAVAARHPVFRIVTRRPGDSG